MTVFDPRLPPVPPSQQTPRDPEVRRPVAPAPGSVANVAAPGQLPEPVASRVATLAMFALTTAFCAMVGTVAYDRGDLASNYFDGRASLSELEASDDRLQWLALALIGVELCAAAVLAVWTFLTTRNAGRRNPRLGGRPAVAALSWFIPLVHYLMPWSILRVVSRSTRGWAPSSLFWWQLFFFAQAALTAVARRAGKLRTDSTQQDVIATAQRQGYVFFAVAALLAAATISAGVAMWAIDGSTSGRSAATRPPETRRR